MSLCPELGARSPRAACTAHRHRSHHISATGTGTCAPVSAARTAAASGACPGGRARRPAHSCAACSTSRASPLRTKSSPRPPRLRPSTRSPPPPPRKPQPQPPPHHFSRRGALSLASGSHTHTHTSISISNASSSLTYKICEGRQRTGSALGFFALRVRFGFGFGLANADDEQQRAKKNGGKSRKGKRRSFRGLLAGAASVSASLENRGDQCRRRRRSRSARDGIGRNERCAVCCVRAGSETSAGATSASASASCDDGDGEHWSDSLIEVRQRNADLRGTWERLHTEFRRHRAFLEHLRADYEQSKDLGAAPRNSTNRSHYSTVLYTCTV